MSENEKPDYGIVVVAPAAKQGPLTWLRARFVAGMLIALPIVATFVILEFLINLIDSFVVPLLPASLRPETYLDYAVPGFGLIILVVFLTLVGAAATNFLGKFFVDLTDRVLTRVPIVRSVYSVFKQIRDVFQSNTAGQYKEIAMVEYPREGSWVIGFVAGAVKGEMRQRLGENYVGIFVPTTPNPTSGFLLYVAETKLIRLNMSVEEGAKIIFSGGLVVPDYPLSGQPPAQNSDPSR